MMVNGKDLAENGIFAVHQIPVQVSSLTEWMLAQVIVEIQNRPCFSEDLAFNPRRFGRLITRIYTICLHCIETFSDVLQDAGKLFSLGNNFFTIRQK
jgi:hypothetical protein